MKGRRAVFVLLCALAGAGLLLQICSYCSDVLQLDLSAYVSAAEAVRFGLDPYRTHPDHVPPVWDGTSAYAHSRFLYPPLVADLFVPFALVPYAWAKWIFTLCSLAALVGAVGLAWRNTRPAPGPTGTIATPERFWLFLAILLSAYPVFTLLERGQVDAFTLLLLVAAWSRAFRGSPPNLVSGLWLALATLLKLNAVYLVLFWALRRWWRGVLGFGLGAGGLVLLSAALDGPTALRAYATHELPRIARYGEGGAAAMRLPPDTYAALRGDAPEGSVRRDGHIYRLEGFGFVANASGARVVARAIGARHARAWFSLVSVLVVASALGLLAWALGRRPTLLDPGSELAYCAAALTAVLLAGPLTWTMNVVWLAVAGLLLTRRWPPANAAEARALAALGLGLWLAWIPDQYALGFLFASPPSLGDYKYVVGELFALVSLGFWIRGRSTAPI
ncbi:MAG TPA: glycosyltransferase family 87 protein [Vicinamibacteria bacterium]|nr:glycosyltransferase family 87 protein [Vicinamibacteria bacterium]